MLRLCYARRAPACGHRNRECVYRRRGIFAAADEDEFAGFIFHFVRHYIGPVLDRDGLTVVSHRIIAGTYRKCLGSMSGILSFDDGGFRFIQFVRVIRNVF